MCSLIGFGHWSRYYIYILIADLARFLKDDILGVGVDKQIIVPLRIVYHPEIILLIGFTSDFIIGMIVWCIFNYREKKVEKMKNFIPLMENEKELSKENSPDLTFELRDSSASSQPINRDDNELSKTPSVNRDTSLKYYLIHNELSSEVDVVKKSSPMFILLSSGLIAIKEFVYKIYGSNDVFNFYFLNLISIIIILKCFYKKKIYRHHMLSVVLVSVVSLICLISFTLIMILVEYKDEKRRIKIDFEGSYYLIFVLLIIFLIISVCFCTGLILQKNLMQSQFIASYKFIFYKGIFGICFCIIALIFSTNFSCGESQISRHRRKEENNNNNNDTISKEEMPYTPIRCKDHYENESYFDNFYSYFNNTSRRLPNITTGEIFISIGYFGFNFISDFSIILVNKFLTPFHVLITESFYSVIHTLSLYLIKFSKNDIDKEEDSTSTGKKSRGRNRFREDMLYRYYFSKPEFVWIQFVSVFFEFIGYLIYMEIIQFNFCGLDRDISKNIKKRAERDPIISNHELYEDSDDISIETLEMEQKEKKNK